MTSRPTGDIDDTCPYELSHIYELIKAEYGAVLQQYQNTRIAQGRLEAHLKCRVSPLLLRINRVTHFMTEDLEMNESQKSRILEIELELVQQLRDRRKVEADQCEAQLKNADGYRRDWLICWKKQRILSRQILNEIFLLARKILAHIYQRLCLHTMTMFPRPMPSVLKRLPKMERTTHRQ